LPGSILSSEAAALSAAAGCPTATSFASTARSASPVARFRFPSHPAGSPEGSQRGVRIILLPSPLPPREPGWPSAGR